MHDGILGRMSSKFMFSLLCMGYEDVREHADVIVHSCIRTASLSHCPVVDSLYEPCHLPSYLQQRFRQVYESDPCNTENMVSLLIQQISGRPELRQYVSSSALQALEQAQSQTQVTILPDFQGTK